MITYWVLFFIPAFFALTRPTERWNKNISLIIWVTLSIVIGLRHAVGGDWNNYINQFNMVNNRTGSFLSIFTKKDALYDLLNWISYHLQLGIYGVNLVCGTIFSGGLVYFCRNTPRPWIALTVAIPYLVIVVSMGYTRQSVGIGILMYGYIMLEKGRIFNYLKLFITAAYFHFSSLVMLPLIAPFLIGFKRRATSKKIANILLFAGGSMIIFIYLVRDKLYFLIYGYIYNNLESQGAIIRIGLNLIPAVIFLVYGSRLKLRKEANTLWTWISINCVIFAIGLFFFPKSTVIDRVALYAVPIQLFVASRFPDFKIIRVPTTILNTIVVLFSFLVQYMWLLYGSFSAAWIPYRNLLFQ